MYGMLNFIFIDGPYLTKAMSLPELTDGWDAMHQRRGESFTSARKRLITDLITNLKGRFESITEVINAMKIANFRVWPIPEDVDEVEG